MITIYLLGNNAQPSADGVSNEVTIGNDDVTKTRLNGNVVTEGGFYGNSLTVSDGTSVSYNSANDSLQYNSNVGNRWVIAGSTSMLLTKAVGEDATLRVPGLATAVSTAVPNICVSSSGVFQRTTGTSGPGTGVIKQVLFNATDENVIIDYSVNDQWVSLKSDITITPGSTDSRVLLNFASSISMSNGPEDKIGIRRSTDNAIITEWVSANINGDNPALIPLDYLDSPNTTSAVTYTLMGYAYCNRCRSLKMVLLIQQLLLWK